MEPDPVLRSLLNEWKAPEPSSELDSRITNAYRNRRKNPSWSRLWRSRVSLPAPAFAAMLLVIVALLLLEFRPPPPRAPIPSESAIVTRINATGFQPLPNGDARLVSAKEVLK